MLPGLGLKLGGGSSSTGPVTFGNVVIGSNASGGGISWLKILFIAALGFVAWRWWLKRK